MKYMAVNKSKTRSALGGNPLSQGIFSKTEIEPQQLSEVEKPEEYIIQDQENKLNSLESRLNNQDSIINKIESRFLNKGEREAVNLRLPLELNDWLNDLIRKGKRQHGAKIPKEIWVQAALELFKSMPVNWEEIDSEENLLKALLDLESRFKNL
jgi:hypothetical protein